MGLFSWIPGVGAALDAIGTIGGLINGSKTNEANLQAVRETNAANAELAKYNWEQQKEMWNAQNAYNTPSAQMARYRDAGLNPNLIYGQGSSGNSPSIPSPATPTMQAAHLDRLPFDNFHKLSDSLQQAYNFSLQREKLQKENDLLDSQAAAQRANSIKSLAEINGITWRGKLLNQEFNQKNMLFPYQVSAARQALQSTTQDIISKTNKNSMFELEKTALEIQIQLARSGIVKNQAQASLFSQEILESAARITNLAEQTNNTRILGQKLGIERDFASATFVNRVEMVAQELLNARLKGRGIDLSNIFQQNYNDYRNKYGYANDNIVTGTLGTLFYNAGQFGSALKNGF